MNDRQDKLNAFIVGIQKTFVESVFLPGEDTTLVSRLIVLDDQGDFFAGGYVASCESGIRALWALAKFAKNAAKKANDLPGEKQFNRILLAIEDEMSEATLSAIDSTPEEKL